jgi:hypothetical protein
MDLFYASTTISIGNGKIASFWDSPWLNGTKPKVIAPLIYEASTRKRWKVNQALLGHAWVKKIKMDINLTIQHLHEYIRLWTLLRGIHLNELLEDTVTWNTTENGEYSAAAAYKAQFFGALTTNMNRLPPPEDQVLRLVGSP